MAAKEIPVWVLEYQNRIELARLEYQQMKIIEAPEEAELGHGELEMPNVNSGLVQKQLSELAQPVVHIIQACNEEKEVLDDECESVRANIEILEARINTDRLRVENVAGEGMQMQL